MALFAIARQALLLLLWLSGSSIESARVKLVTPQQDNHGSDDKYLNEPRCNVPSDFPRSPDTCCENPLKACWLDDGEWECSCSECERVAKAFTIFNVKVRAIRKLKKPSDVYKLLTNTQKPRELQTYADLNPINSGFFYDDGSFAAGPEYVLFLLPSADFNGAFAYNRMLCHRIDCWKHRGKEVVVRYVRSIPHAKRVLEMFPDRSLSHVTLGGHGTSASLSWGHFTPKCCLRAYSDRTDRFLDALKGKLRVDGGVTLDSCSTAKDRWLGKNLFMYVASKMTGVKVIASKVSLYDDMWKPTPGAECIADDSVQFIKNEEDVTMVSDGALHKCSDLSVAELYVLAADKGLCASGCHTTCEEIGKEHGGLTLKVLPDAEVEHSSCNFGNTRQVCQVIANDFPRNTSFDAN